MRTIMCAVADCTKLNWYASAYRDNYIYSFKKNEYFKQGPWLKLIEKGVRKRTWKRMQKRGERVRKRER